MVGDYKRSKFLAEREAEAAAARGLPIVIVNPSAPVGPWDWKPTPTGRMLVDYLKRRMFAYLDTGLNLVHVRDVARGHLLAAERGRPGERYILGHRDGNLGLRAIFERLAPYTGIAAPRVRLPYRAALALAVAAETVARPASCASGSTPTVLLGMVTSSVKTIASLCDPSICGCCAPKRAVTAELISSPRSRRG